MKPPLFAAGLLAALAIGGCAKAPGASPGKNGTVVTGAIGPTVQECLDLGGTVEANAGCGGQKVQAGCTTPAPTASGLERLQGTWEGAVVGDRSDDRVTITITGDSLHFHRDTNFWFKTTFTLPAGTDPQELHATIKDCPPPRDSIGKVVVAFFKIEDGKLTLAAMGERTDEMPKSFEAADDEGWTRYELRKVQAQKKIPNHPKTR
jgi:uncharacterized protein (TIGR03067 family)